MIDVFRFHKMKNQGSLQALFSIRLQKWKGFCIHNIAYFHSDGKKWITLPSQKYEKDGKTNYLPYCAFPQKEVNDAFKSEILKALDEYLQKQNPNEE